MGFQNLNSKIWILLFSTALGRASLFMSMPFLTVVMTKYYHAGPLWTGIAVGAAPLMLSLGGFFGGNLADRFGRPRVLILSLLFHVIFMGALGFARSPWIITFLCLAFGFARACFEPACQALISDLAPAELKQLAFNYRYIAINLGAGIGPVAGVWLSGRAPGDVFFGSALLFAINLVMVAVILGRTAFGKVTVLSRVSLKRAFQIVASHKQLRLYILGALFVYLGFSQLTSNLAQILNAKEVPLIIYSYLLSLNAILIIVLQAVISRWTAQLETAQATIAGCLVSGIGLIGLGLAKSVPLLIMAMAVFTLGEMLFFPNQTLLIDSCATEAERGAFFGASGLSMLGFSLGPVLGGFLLTIIPFWMVLPIIGGIVMFSALFFRPSWNLVPRLVSRGSGE